MLRILFIVIIIFAAFITNPSELDYKSEIQSQVMNEMNLSGTKNPVGEVFTSAIFETAIWSVAKTSYSDFKVCSTFEMYVGTQKVKYFGIFGQILPISGKEALTDIDVK
jgi:hypothetical protein